MPEDNLPKTIGRYEIKHLLGAGAMGSVYLAEDPRIKRKLAIKVVKLDAIKTEADRKEFLARFQREAEVSGVLNDPGIVTIYDVGDSELGPFLAMEFVPGKPLDGIIKGGGLANLSLKSKLFIICGIATALDHAHSHGIVHRDVKPGNVMITEDGRPKLMDFGIAKREDASLTQTGTFLGTPSYASPEQIKEGHATGLSDVFSFGVVAFELLAGQLPFPGTSINTILYRIVNEPPVEIKPPVSGLLPEAWQRVFGRGLAKNPKDRYPNCTAFARELIDSVNELDKASKAELLGGLRQNAGPITLTAAPGGSDEETHISAHHRQSRSKGPMYAGVGFGVAAIAVAGFFLFRKGGGEAVNILSKQEITILRSGKPVPTGSPLLLKPGERVTIQAQGFQPFEYVHQAGNKTPNIELSPVISDVELRTEPTGAKVVLNTLEKGTTPCKVPWNHGQTNSLTFSKDDKSIQAEFQVGEAPKGDQIFVLVPSSEQRTSGETPTIDAKAPVPVRFNGEFAVRVKVDGKDMGEKREIALDPGKTYKLDLSSAHVYFKESRSITVEPGKPVSVPLPGLVRITVSTHPNDGIVVIDGTSTGVESIGIDTIRVVRGAHAFSIQGKSGGKKEIIEREGQVVSFPVR